MAKIVAISDLHLGDRDEGEGSVLSFPSVCKNFTDQLADITGGLIETLVINGDCFEACVPTRTVEENFLHKTSVFDLYNSTVEDAQRFFATLTAKIKINRLVWVPGNHDFTLYMLMRKYGIISGPTTSPYSGYPLRKDGVWSSASGVQAKLFGSNIMNIDAAYPNFVYKEDGKDWPVALFTHGHLFDSQVLNPSKDFLSAVGLWAETGHIFDPIQFDVAPGKWMQTLVELSSERIMEIWTQNLDLIKEAVYNYAQRRKIRIVCGERPKVPGTHVWLAALAGLNITENHRWYCNGFIQDMSPVLTMLNPPPSYFVVGHTHFGGANTMDTMDGTSFQVYDLGGWTLDAIGHKDNVPHTHVLIWNAFPATPNMYALNVGKP